MADTMWIRGENGALHCMDVPLPLGIASRLERGDLTRVNEDGTPWAEELDGAEQELHELPEDAPPLPRRTDSRAVWTEFAVSQGMDRARAVGMTKGDLIEAFTAPAAE